MELRSFLLEYKIRQTAFAEKVGISDGHLSKLVNGTHKPSLELALKISGVTNGRVTPFDWGFDSVSKSSIGSSHLTTEGAE